MKAGSVWLTLCVWLVAGSTAAQFQLQDPTAEPATEAELDGSDEEAEEQDAEEAAPETPAQDGAAQREAEEPEADAPANAVPVGTTTLFQLEPPAPEPTSRFLLPPLMIEETATGSTTAAFPLFFSQSEGDEEELFIPPYYRLRSADLHADVVFPFFWSFRGTEEDTLVVPPFYLTEADDGSSYGLPPLFFHSHDEDSSFTLIPPLLMGHVENGDSATTIAGLFYRDKDGPEIDWGVFPFLWVFEREFDTDVLAPPFYFRFEDAEDETALTIVPPVYVSETATHTAFGLAPLFHAYHDDTTFSLTVPPALFHYGEFEDGMTLITPLFGYTHDADSSTLITPLYQNHRGETDLDAVAPFFFWSRNEKQDSQQLLVPPLFWHFEDPLSTTTIAAPFYARFHETGRYTTWVTPLVGRYESHEEDSEGLWIFPNIQVSSTPDSNTFNLHPLLYSTEAETHRHLVIPPIFWDFEDFEDDTRTTVGFPIFWRFENPDTVTQLALNTYYRRVRRKSENPGWEFHFFPLFAFGEDGPRSHWWTILYGLAGYQRQGSYARGQAFWIPFDADGPED